MAIKEYEFNLPELCKWLYENDRCRCDCDECPINNMLYDFNNRELDFDCIIEIETKEE